MAFMISITIPQKNNIRCLMCKTRVHPEKYSSITDGCHRNKLNCRIFLQGAPGAMAAPISDPLLCEDGSFYAIFNKDFFKDSTFEDYCVALNIDVIKRLDPIPTSIFEDCLRYTIEYKLAPQWNKLGDKYLVEGQDFLSSITEYANAIQLDVKNICANTAELRVQALKLKIPLLKLIADSQPSEVYELPSLRKGNVISNKSVSLRTYETFREYWQIMYGYILPNYEKKLSEYRIVIQPHKSLRIYLETCLLSGRVEEIRLDDSTFIRTCYTKFMNDLKERVTRLCGQQLDIIIVHGFPAIQTVEVTFSATGMSTRSIKHF